VRNTSAQNIRINSPAESDASLLASPMEAKNMQEIIGGEEMIPTNHSLQTTIIHQETSRTGLEKSP
jgi:hypothetical protein